MPLRYQLLEDGRLPGTFAPEDQELLVCFHFHICRVVLEALPEEVVRVSVDRSEVLDFLKPHRDPLGFRVATYRRAPPREAVLDGRPIHTRNSRRAWARCLLEFERAAIVPGERTACLPSPRCGFLASS